MILSSLRVPMEIVGERRRQDEKWGGEVHDDRHSPEDWMMIIDHYLNRVLSATRKNNSEEYRKSLIRVAAVAIAAIEAEDRKTNGSN